MEDLSLQVGLSRQHRLISERKAPFLSSRVFLRQGLISQGVDSKYICKLTNAVISFFIMTWRGRNSNTWLCTSYVSVCSNRHQFGVKILSYPVHGYILTVILFDYHFSHLFQYPQIRIVQLQIMPTDKGYTYKAYCVKLLQSVLTIFKLLSSRVIKNSSPVRDNWTDLADGVGLPCLEPSGEFFAVDNNVIIHGKVDSRLASLWNCVAPVQGIVRCEVKVDWAFPILRIFKNSHLFRSLLIIPNNVHFSDDWAVHFGVVFQKAIKYRIISSSCISHGHKSKSKLQNNYVYGTFGSVAVISPAIDVTTANKISNVHLFCCMTTIIIII